MRSNSVAKSSPPAIATFIFVFLSFFFLRLRHVLTLGISTFEVVLSFVSAIVRSPYGTTFSPSSSP